MVQADGEVVGDVWIVRRQTVGIEPGLLGFGPALLAAQGVSQGKAQGEVFGGVGLGGEAVSEAAFGLQRICDLEPAEAGEGNRVLGPGDECAPKERLGFGLPAFAQGDCAETVEGVDIQRVGSESLKEERPRKDEVVGGVSIVGAGCEEARGRGFVAEVKADGFIVRRNGGGDGWH